MVVRITLLTTTLISRQPHHNVHCYHILVGAQLLLLEECLAYLEHLAALKAFVCPIHVKHCLWLKVMGLDIDSLEILVPKIQLLVVRELLPNAEVPLGKGKSFHLVILVSDCDLELNMCPRT